MHRLLRKTQGKAFLKFTSLGFQMVSKGLCVLSLYGICDLQKANDPRGLLLCCYVLASFTALLLATISVDI